ncbi:MAG: YfiR family protein [Candidatus Ozemobacteraceae bacterium]
MPKQRLIQEHPHHTRAVSFRALFRLPIAVVLFLSGFAVFATADSLSEDELKAAFVFNFTKYIEWPEQTFASPTDDFKVGVAGMQPLSGNLELLNGHVTHGHPIKVINDLNKEDWGKYHVLFVGNPLDSHGSEQLEKIAFLPVLTVSDIPNFAKSGGIIGLKIVDKKVRFDINLTAAANAGIKISSQLLKMALEVIR